MTNITVAEIQEKTEIIKRKFVALAQQFEEETGTYLHLSVSHGFEGKSRILTCEVKIPETEMKIDTPKSEVVPL